MFISYWVIIPFCILFVISVFSGTRMYMKLESMERVNEEYGIQLEYYISFFLDFQKSIMDSIVRLKDIDTRGTFSSDDEVGFAFTTIQSVFDNLNQLFTLYVYESDDDQEKEKEEKTVLPS